MIDRKTALICAATIAVMLAAAVWRITTVQNGAPLQLLLLFVFPACSAFVVSVLYCQCYRVKGDVTKVQPWRTWGTFVSISYCLGVLSAQAVVIIMSLDLGIRSYLWAIYRTLFALIGIMALLAINQMPKLPWFERRFSPGGDLGPIYGPRYMRTQSRILFVFMAAAIAYSLTPKPNAEWNSALYILVATVCLFVQSIAWRYHLGRKWNLEQMASRGVGP